MWITNVDDHCELATLKDATITQSPLQPINGHLRTVPGIDAGSAGISVTLIDNEPVRRAGLRAVLERQPAIVIAEAIDHSAIPTLRLKASGNRAVVLLASGQSVAYDANVIVELSRSAPQCGVVVIRQLSTRREADRLLAAGARGCIRPDIGESALYGAVAVAAEGGMVFVPAIPGQLVAEYGCGQPDEPEAIAAGLTTRQQQVLSLLSMGMSNRAIAKQLVLSENTVKKHVSETLHKIRQPDRFRAGLYAIRQGICV